MRFRSQRSTTSTIAAPDKGWLRKFYRPGSDEPQFDLTPATEKAIAWLSQLSERSFVGTESRLLTLFELLKQMSEGSESNPAKRIAELHKRRDDIDSEIARTLVGDLPLLDDSALKDRFQQFMQLALELLTDSREVEQPVALSLPTRFYIVAERAISIATDFAHFGSDIAQLRKKLRTSGAEIVPRLKHDLEQNGLPATVRAKGDNVFMDYTPLATGTGYVASAVMLEFDARSTGEPSEPRAIRCDEAAYLQGVEFPRQHHRVMRDERTFWEKATAIHFFCAQGEFRGGDRFTRHWRDVTKLDAAGFAAAIADKALARAVADHKSIFFAEKNMHGDAIDYHAAVAGGLQLVPDDGNLAGRRRATMKW